MVGMFQVIPRIVELSLVKNVIKVKRSVCSNTLLLAHHGNERTKLNIFSLYCSLNRF